MEPSAEGVPPAQAETPAEGRPAAQAETPAEDGLAEDGLAEDGLAEDGLAEDGLAGYVSSGDGGPDGGDADDWVSEASFRERQPEASEAPSSASEAEAEPSPRTPRPLTSLLAAHLERVGAATLRLGLAEAERAHDHLAETAIWLALANLDLELGPALERWLEGGAWNHVVSEPTQAPWLQSPPLQRLALGLTLVDAARQEGTPASARVLAALAAVALGSADPPTGRRLQPTCAELGLLPLTEQIPVAAPVRQLLLEFRHLDLRSSPSPAFIARIEDLLDRLDRTGLLGIGLQDHPAASRSPDLSWWIALTGSRSPSLVLLARLTLAEGIVETGPLLEALRARDPSWGEPGAEARLGALRGTLAERLGDLEGQSAPGG